MDSPKPLDPSLVVEEFAATDLQMDVAHTVEISVDMTHDPDEEIRSSKLVFFGSDEVGDIMGAEEVTPINVDERCQGMGHEVRADASLSSCVPNEGSESFQPLMIDDNESQVIRLCVQTAHDCELSEKTGVVSEQGRDSSLKMLSSNASNNLKEDTNAAGSHSSQTLTNSVQEPAADEVAQTQNSFVMINTTESSSVGQNTMINTTESSSVGQDSVLMIHTAESTGVGQDTREGSSVGQDQTTLVQTTSSLPHQLTHQPGAAHAILVLQNLILHTTPSSLNAASQQQYLVHVNSDVQSVLNVMLSQSQELGLNATSADNSSTNMPSSARHGVSTHPSLISTEMQSSEISHSQNKQPLQNGQSSTSGLDQKRKRKPQWSEHSMQDALRAVWRGKSVRSAARDYAIPHQTLVTRIKKLKLEGTFRRYQPGGDLSKSGMTISSEARNKARGKQNIRWTEVQMDDAIRMCNSGESVNHAAKVYGIPVGTLHGRVTGRVKRGGKRGSPSYLTPDEEKHLETLILLTIDKGFEEVNAIVKTFVLSKVQNRRHPFKNAGPGKKWWTLFLARHLKVAKKIMKLWHDDKLQFEDKKIVSNQSGAESSGKLTDMMAGKSDEREDVVVDAQKSLSLVAEVLSICQEQLQFGDASLIVQTETTCPEQQFESISATVSDSNRAVSADVNALNATVSDSRHPVSVDDVNALNLQLDGNLASVICSRPTSDGSEVRSQVNDISEVNNQPSGLVTGNVNDACWVSNQQASRPKRQMEVVNTMSEVNDRSQVNNQPSGTGVNPAPTVPGILATHSRNQDPTLSGLLSVASPHITNGKKCTAISATTSSSKSSGLQCQKYSEPETLLMSPECMAVLNTDVQLSRNSSKDLTIQECNGFKNSDKSSRNAESMSRKSKLMSANSNNATRKPDSVNSEIESRNSEIASENISVKNSEIVSTNRDSEFQRLTPCTDVNIEATCKRKWREKDMEKALRATWMGKLGIRAAARKYGIPHSTLVTRIEKLKRDSCYNLPLNSRCDKEGGTFSKTASKISSKTSLKSNCVVPNGNAKPPDQGVSEISLDPSQSCGVVKTPYSQRKMKSHRTESSLASKEGLRWHDRTAQRSSKTDRKKCTQGLKHRRTWSEDDMARACEACKGERYTISEAARIFRIPRPTLYMRLSGKAPPCVPLGRKTFLTTEEEDHLEKEIILYAKKGYTLTQGMVASFVNKTVKGCKHPFKDDGPSHTWWKLFHKRHPRVQQHIFGLWQKSVKVASVGETGTKGIS